jgi:LuxR family maltose regulon positive regulatory protein
MLKSDIAQVAWNAHGASYQVLEKAEKGTTPPQRDFEGQTWQEWLAQRSSFSFSSRDGYRFTARKESRARGRTYWVAYRKAGGKLTHSYIGRSEDVTLTRLEQVARSLSGGDNQDDVTPRFIEGDSLQTQQARQETPVTMGWQDQYLSTKFFMPAAPHTLIARPRLFSLLDGGRGRRLTLVSAPAGFGKTTLLSAWMRAQPPGNPLVAWVSLDEADNDPARFWSYVLTALDQGRPGTYSKLAAYVRGEAQPSLQYVTAACLNRLAEYDLPLILLLDDYHLIMEPVVHTSLTTLIEHLPFHVRVILSTRADPPLPLIRLRGRGQLLEVRADQLRATPQEARAFLGEVMHIDLPEQELAALDERTEGWLVGLQLVGLSLQGRPTSLDLFEEASGQQSYILDYLTEEVLRRQSLAIQHFLLYTSILERLTAPLCDAVTGQTGSQQMLETLQRANLFLVPLDSQRRWYRYHALFSEALRTRLEQAEGTSVRELHLRACQWFAGQGDTITAVQHAMSAHDWERAADLLEPLAKVRFWGKEQPVTRRFLENLPTEMLRSRPLLALLYALILDPDTSFTVADAWMQVAEEGLNALLTEQATATIKGMPSTLSERENLLGEMLIIRAAMRATRGDALAAYAYIRQARFHLVEMDIEKQALLAFNESMIHMVLGEAVPATARIRAALIIWESLGNNASTAIIIQSLNLAAYYLNCRGLLQEAWGALEQAVQLGSRPGGFPYSNMASVYAYQANLLREWNRLDEALVRARMAVQLTSSTAGSMAFTAVAFLFKVLLARGEIEEASTVLQQAEHLMDHLQNPYIDALYVLVDRVRFWLARGEVSRAFQWAEQLEREDSLPSTLAQERVDVALAHVKLVQSKPGEALTLLMPRLETAIKQERWGNVIELSLLIAVAHQMRGEMPEALTLLAEAVRLAQPEEYIRSFVDEGAPMAAMLSALRASTHRQDKSGNDAMMRYVDRVLAAFPPDITGDRHAALHPLPDPLSIREREVLELLARGASNQEIAEALVITVDTVKRHVSNILSKLGVSNRTQAVAQAYAFKIIHAEP